MWLILVHICRDNLPKYGRANAFVNQIMGIAVFIQNIFSVYQSHDESW